MKRKINLGAGNKIMDTKIWINHDIRYHRAEIEQAWDLNVYPYPWLDNSFNEIKCYDVYEHLREPFPRFFNECWRILERNGTLCIRVAGVDSEHCWSDPTHFRPFNINSFDFLDMSTDFGNRYSFYTDKKWQILEGFIDIAKELIFKMIPIK